MKDMKNLEFDTKLVHAGMNPNRHNGSTGIPIYETASFAYDTAADIAQVFQGKRFGYIYSRIANPTVAAFEERVCSLEDGVGAIAASSGMAAISTAILTLTEQGDEIIAGKSLFGGTYRLFDRVLRKYGIKFKLVDPADPKEIEKSLSNKTRLVFIEAIGNPKMDVPDIQRISNILQKCKVPLIVDSTLVTPYLFKAKNFNVDIVVHSATKYLTGNGTAVGGVLIDTGNYKWENSPVNDIKEAVSRTGSSFAFLYAARKIILENTGSCLSPFNAYLHYCGLETLSLRMAKQCGNAMELALYLADHAKIEHVFYPGLSENRFFDIAKRQFNNRFGGLLTFRLKSKEKCFAFIEQLNLVLNLANLGDSRTLIIHPASTIYHGCTKDEMESAGVTDNLLRVSVGIEDIRDIRMDFQQALDQI